MDRIGIIMHGVTGRMGYNQHLVRSILAIRDQGGVTLPNGDRADARSDPRRPQRRQDRRRWRSSTASTAGRTDLDAALANPDDTIFFDAGTTQMRAELLSKAHRRRQARLLREADRRRPRASPSRWPGQGPRPASSTASCRTSCSCPACSKLAHAARLRLLRPHPLGARRVRLLGVRGRLAAGAAAVLELPQGRRRRHHPRHALPLALRARQPLRRGEGGQLPRRHPHPRARRRGRQALPVPTPTTPPTPPSSSRAASSPRSTRPGTCACAATTSSPSRSTARTARPSPA